MFTEDSFGFSVTCNVSGVFAWFWQFSVGRLIDGKKNKTPKISIKTAHEKTMFSKLDKSATLNSQFDLKIWPF
jgi:hypothetical protein